MVQVEPHLARGLINNMILSFGIVRGNGWGIRYISLARGSIHSLVFVLVYHNLWAKKEMKMMKEIMGKI